MTRHEVRQKGRILRYYLIRSVWHTFTDERVCFYV
jgi:hypothetical protein